MSRFVASFLVTTMVAVPAAWHVLGAGIQTDGKKLRPLQQTLELDDARVTLDVDHALVTTGDAVTAKLRAFSDTPKQVAIDLTLLQSNNYAGERVEVPSVAIDHEKLVLQATPDGGPVVTTRLVLGKRPPQLAQTDSFVVYIAPHGDKPPTTNEFSDHRRDYDTPVQEGKAAAVSIRGWSGNSFAMTIVPTGAITGTAPFEVAVHMKNTGGRLPHRPWVQLGTQLVNGSISAGDDYAIDELDPEVGGGDDDGGFAPGQEIVKRYTVTPSGKHATVTFLAEATAWDEAPGPVIAGAMDVKTFAVVEPTHEVAAR